MTIKEELNQLLIHPRKEIVQVKDEPEDTFEITEYEFAMIEDGVAVKPEPTSSSNGAAKNPKIMWEMQEQGGGYRCGFCWKSFLSYDLLNTHMTSHTCPLPECGMKFRDTYKLNR